MRIFAEAVQLIGYRVRESVTQCSWVATVTTTTDILAIRGVGRRLDLSSCGAVRIASSPTSSIARLFASDRLSSAHRSFN